MDEKTSLLISQLTEEQQYVIKLIGFDAYKKLVLNYGGCSIYICHPSTLEKFERNSKIYSEFSGSNYKALAKKYHLSENTIRNIIIEMKNN